ncbi:MAG: KUP/HAK/KT family potassium transporter [Candidatus Velthaea sp.]
MSSTRARPLSVVGALGIVFGDIGTSPLYTTKTCFLLAGATAASADVVGIISLICWTLTIVVCLKYITFIMRVDHDGEGGILALLALAAPPARALGGPIGLSALTVIVTVGASMLMGDGIITPAISVISAVEGISVVSNAFTPYVVPISAVVLLGLFLIQKRGTERVGRLFGPVMIFWFIAIGVAGLVAVVHGPRILAALNPLAGVGLIARHGWISLAVFGGVVLAVTGVEALYADLSHFGRKPIVIAWYWLVFPSLLLNYLGQGAAILADPRALNSSPFYALAPGWTLVPFVVLATAATVIASQALISGVFTVVEQAIALNLAPRMTVLHTSRSESGQVFVPAANVALAIGCLLLVFAFRSSDRLAAAYGLAVSVTMLCTSIAFYQVIRTRPGWPRPLAIALLVCFVIVDGTFVVTGLPKFIDGGWVPMAISAALTTIAITWLEGRRRLSAAIAREQTPFGELRDHIAGLKSEPKGTMVFFTPDLDGVPFIASHRWVAIRARQERIVLMRFSRSTKPYLTDAERLQVEWVGPHLARVDARVGFMEPISIDPIVRACEMRGLELDSDNTSYIYADPTIGHAANGLPRWQRTLFEFLQRNARRLPDDLGIRPDRRVELGLSVEL